VNIELSVGDEIPATCPVCKKEKLASVTENLEKVKILEHLSLTKDSRCKGSGDEVPIQK